MSSIQWRLALAFFMVFPFLAGCGGSSSGGSVGGGGASDPTLVTITFKEGTPSSVETRVGNGSFSPQSLASGNLTLSIPKGTSDFSVAYTCVSAQSLTLQFDFESNIGDGTEFGLVCPSVDLTGQSGTLAASVDVTAIPGANTVDLAAENGSITTVGGITLGGIFNFSAPLGNDRVEVLAYNLAQQGSTGTFTLLAAKKLENQPVPGALNGGNPVVLGPADETSPEPITYSNVPSGYTAPVTGVGVLTQKAGGFSIGQATAQYRALPAAALPAGDYYNFGASSSSIATPTETVRGIMTATAAGPVSFAFPAPWSYGGPTPAALPVFNLAYTGFSGKPAIMRSVFVLWHGGNNAPGNIEILVTANHQNGSSIIAFPDVSALPGFLPAPASGATVTWMAQIVQSAAGIDALQGIPANATATMVQNSGTYTVP